MAKDKRALELLNLSLARIESAATVLETSLGNQAEMPAFKRLLKTLQQESEAARQHMITIQFHLGHLL